MLAITEAGTTYVIIAQFEQATRMPANHIKSHLMHDMPVSGVVTDIRIRKGCGMESLAQYGIGAWAYVDFAATWLAMVLEQKRGPTTTIARNV